MQLILGLLLGILTSSILFVLFRKRLIKETNLAKDELSQTVELRLQQLLPDILHRANEQLITMADQKLGAEKKEIKTDIENKRSEIERLVSLIKDDLKESQKTLQQSEKERTGSFMALEKALSEYKIVTDKLSVSTENLRKVLSNNQLRGQFGEQVADELLKMSGFVRGIDYTFNKEQQNSETRPDFSIFLPDRTKINVDSKFPYSNLQKMSETDLPEMRETYRKAFEKDVKEKIKQVTSRDYINPEDKTVDFVILFIPNEMIFSYIYDKMNDIWAEGLQKKVIFTGPFSFTAILRMIKQSYDNFKVQENVHQIIAHVKSFEKEFEKFNEEFSKIGDRIVSLSRQYDEVSRTRTNQLVRTMEKVALRSPDKDEVKGPSF